MALARVVKNVVEAAIRQRVARRVSMDLVLLKLTHR